MTTPSPNSVYVVSNATSSTSPFIEVFEARDPNAYDTNYPIQKRWFNTSNNSEWVLKGFTSYNALLQAEWVQFSGASGVVEDFAMQTGTTPVVPLASTVTFNGAVVAAGTHPVRTNGTDANTMALEVQISQALAATDATKIGLSNFNSAHFSVDANGFVSLAGGGEAIDSVQVDAFTAPGINPVLPSAAGLLTITGSSPVAGTNPVRTNSLAANTFAVQVQKSQAIAATDATKVGLAAFDSAHFTVDANGFVSFGGSGAVYTVTADTGGALSPTAGNFNFFGGTGISTSGSGSTVTITSTGSSPAVGVVNLGITYSASTFKITSASGSALSASNPAYVTLQSKTTGLVKTISITADQSFVDATGASTISGNVFGVASGIAYGEDVPFYIYAVINDSENAISFMISRFCNTPVSPASAKIGKTGSAVASTQGSFFALSNPTVTDYDANPCLMIGSFRMRMSAGNDWTVQTLANNDGIGQFNDDTWFATPSGQFGAASGKYFYNNGGTAPTFTSQGIRYHITKSGQFVAIMAMTTCSVDGVGAVELKPALPFTITNGSIAGSGYFLTLSTYLSITLELLLANSNSGHFITSGAANGIVKNNDISVASGVSFSLSFSYFPEFV